MKTYTGGCHCGRYRYEVDTELENVIECNCSHCHMKGLILAFTPFENFRLISGNEDELTDYQFNKKVIHHQFCPTCGVQSFSWGTDGQGNNMRAINVRCLDGVVLSDLTVTPMNGKDF